MKKIVEKAKTSCLDESDVEALNMKPAKPSELKGLGLPVFEAMRIPYFNADGSENGFVRYRYMEDTRKGIAKQTDAKPLRYVQPPNSEPQVYLPPISYDWSTVIENTSQPIAITEGEFKAACCTKHVMPCVGLGGVYSFRAKATGHDLIPQLQQFKWRGRQVVFIYDTDAKTNLNVMRAQDALATKLVELGAMVLIADLPDTPAKGLDDYAYAEGVDALKAVVTRARFFETCKALYDFNDEVAYIKNSGFVQDLHNTSRKLRPYDFTAHAYANRFFTVRRIDKKGELELKELSLPVEWLKWPQRHTLNSVVYEPGLPTITEDNDFNEWPGWGCEPVEGSVAPWTELLNHLFEGSPEERDWFERWCALPLQQPGAKLYTASVIWGIATGTGKSLLGYSLGRIYGKNFTEIGDRELQDGRNEWAQNKQFVLGDDVTGKDQRKYADHLKAMITQLDLRLNPKYIQSYTVRDHINYMFTSNHPDAFFIEDDDRRFFIHEVTANPKSEAWYRDYMRWLDKEDGAKHLFHHLLQLDLKGLTATSRAPRTNARDAMIDDGLSALGRWVRMLKDSPDLVLKVGAAELKHDLFTSQDLLALYDPMGQLKVTASAMARELKRAGFKQAYKRQQLRLTNGGKVRLFIVRNEDKWMLTGGPLLVKHYEAAQSSKKGKL